MKHFLLAVVTTLMMAGNGGTESPHTCVIPEPCYVVEEQKKRKRVSKRRSIIARVVKAANEIARKPYVWGGGHGSFQSSGYDCSGSVSYALHGGGLLNEPETSGTFESYGAAGSGRNITIYANFEHVFMVIEHRRFDTVAQAETGTRWSNTMVSTIGYVTRHPSGF